MNPKVSASLRMQSHSEIERNMNTFNNNYRNSNSEAGLSFNHHLTQTSATSASNHRRQQFSFISDNAVTSSTHSDTENSFDLRLANETLTNDSTATYGSNTTNPSTSTSLSTSSLTEITLSSSSLPSHKQTTSSTTSPCQERIFKRYSTILVADHPEVSSDNDATDLYEPDSNRDNNVLHSSNLRKRCFTCNDYDSVDDYDGIDDLEEARELSSGMSETGSDTDMDTDEADSMTSLDTEKSAKLKRGNHPLLRDKLLAKQKIIYNNNNTSNSKSFTNIRNTDGLLSIAIKTIKLVKRNQLLQQRLTQLQLETTEFIQSVLANPENRHFRQNINQKVNKVDNV